VAGLCHENKRIIEQVRTGQPEYATIGINFHRSQLLKPEGKIQIAVGIIVDPAQPTRASIYFVNDPREREYILLETGRVSPIGRHGAVLHSLAGCAHGVFIHQVAAFSLKDWAGIISPTASAARTTPVLRGANAHEEHGNCTEQKNGAARFHLNGS